MPWLAGRAGLAGACCFRAAAARAAAARAAAALARAAFRARSRAIARRWAACRAAAPLTLSWCTEAAITWSVAADAATLRAAGDTGRVGQAGRRGRGVPGPGGCGTRGDTRQGERRAGRDQRDLRGPAVERLAVQALARGSPSAEGQREPLVGRVRAVGFHPGTGRPPGCGGGSAASGCGAGTGRPAAQKAAVITYAGCLRDPTMPETTIPVAEKYLLGVMRKVTQSHRSPTFTQVGPISGGQAKGRGRAQAGGTLGARRPLS